MIKDELFKVSITDIDGDTRENLVTEEKKGKKGVLVIYTGGTIGSIPKDPNDPNSPMIVATWKEFREAVPVLEEIPFRIDAISFETPLDSANIGPQHWIAMAKIIGNQDIYDRYEGFVILHGTDTMVYTASMLSFMLQNLTKPVIITGSQIPVIKKVRNDALQNLVTAILIANPKYSGIPTVKEVCIFFRDKLLRGNRTRKMDASGYTAFHTPNYPELGKAGDNIEIEEKFLREPQGEFNPVYDLDRNVIMMDLFPGFQDRSKIRDLIFDPGLISAIVLKTYGTGNVPTERPERLISFEEEYKNVFPESVSEETGEGFELKPKLQEIFQEKGLPLSKTPRLFKIDETNWELSDRHDVLKDFRYKIEWKDKQTNIYPISFLDDIQMAVKRGQIIINVTQCPSGSVEQGLYDTSAVLTDCGVLSGQEITPEAALCKLMVILGQANINYWKREMTITRINQNIAGEQDFSIYNTILEQGKQLEDKPHYWYRIPGAHIEGNFKDGDRIARAILRFKEALVKKKPELLFSLNRELREELSGERKQKLLLKFKENEHSLSENFTLSTIDDQKWELIDGVNNYLIEDTGSELKVYEAEKPLKIKIYIDLPPTPDEFQEKRCFAGEFLKQQNKVKQSVTFDITRAAKERLQPGSSFTIIIEDIEGAFEFEGVELSLFIK